MNASSDSRSITRRPNTFPDTRSLVVLISPASHSRIKVERLNGMPRWVMGLDGMGIKSSAVKATAVCGNEFSFMMPPNVPTFPTLSLRSSVTRLSQPVTAQGQPWRLVGFHHHAAISLFGWLEATRLTGGLRWAAISIAVCVAPSKLVRPRPWPLIVPEWPVGGAAHLPRRASCRQ